MSHDRDHPDPRQLPGFEEQTPPAEAEADLLRLRELLHSVPAVEPDEGVWAGVLTRIHDGIRPAKSPPRRSPRPVWALLGVAAAAALVAVLLSRSWWVQTTVPQQVPAEEPFPVAEAQDVDILSIDARDVAGLVVGEPPVSGELVFASLDDVRVLECKCCPKSGNIAKLEPGEVPMLVATAARADAPNDE